MEALLVKRLWGDRNGRGPIKDIIVPQMLFHLLGRVYLAYLGFQKSILTEIRGTNLHALE